MKRLNQINSCLVTGGAGFIGSNLCKYLVESNVDVVCLDNFITGHRSNIASLMNKENFRLIEGDIRDYETCYASMNNVEYVFHQAALGSVPRSIKDPISSTQINITGFVNVLFAAKEAGVKRLVYAASSSTYGDNKRIPKVEEEIGKPLSPYAITKFANELFAENFSKIYNIETVGLRYFNVFGPNQDPNGPYAAVIPKFILSLIKGESPLINGDGNYSRDFTYIDNVIQANFLAAKVSFEQLYENIAIKHDVFNVACGEQTSLNRLFKLIKEALEVREKSISSIKPIYGPCRKGDVPHSKASIEKAAKKLKYSPKFSIEEGLKKVCDWYWEKLR